MLGIALFSWVTKIVGFEGVKIAFFLFFSWQGMALLFLTFLIAIVSTLKWKEILKKAGFSIAFLELFKTYLAGFSIDYFLPMITLGAEVTKAHILQEKNSVPFEKAVASVLIDRILSLTCVLLLVFPGIFLFLLAIGLPSKNTAIILFSFLFLLGASIAFFYFKSARRESILRFLKINSGQALEIEKLVLSFFRSKVARGRVLWLSFLRAGLLFLRAWALIFFLGESIGPFMAWPAFAFAWIGTTIPIPADIGSHEAIQTFAFRALGLGVSKGAAFAMIIRTLETIVSCLGLITLLKFGLKLFEKNLLRKITRYLSTNTLVGIKYRQRLGIDFL